MAKFDLSPTIGKFFDRHFILPLLEFLSNRTLYDKGDLLHARYELLKQTKMVDFENDTYRVLHGCPPPNEAELLRRREEVVKEMTETRNRTAAVLQILTQEEVTRLLSNQKEREKLLDTLVADHNVKFHPDMLDALFMDAKIRFDAGLYDESCELMYFCRLLLPAHHPHYADALWGKLATEILLQKWEVAREDFSKLRIYIDHHTFEGEMEHLWQRAWLIHWGLFIFYNHAKGRDDIVDMCLNQQQYLTTIQACCPHILRYVAVAVVVSKRRNKNLKELVKIIETEGYQYRDPVTELLECLYIKYDFDGAQQKLKECQSVLWNDFFLTGCEEEFIESARFLIFEMYCRIHHCISIKDLSEKLNMKPDAAERWIVNLIRNAQLDAKIDSKLGQIVMGTKAIGVHEQVMENTKRLAFRVQQMVFQAEKVLKEKQVSLLTKVVGILHKK